MENKESSTISTKDLAKRWGIAPQTVREKAKNANIRRLPNLDKDMWLRVDIEEYEKTGTPLQHDGVAKVFPRTKPESSVGEESDNKLVIQEHERAIERLKQEHEKEIALLTKKHIEEIKAISDKDDAVRRSLEKEKKEWDEFKKKESESLQSEREARLSDVAKKENDLALKEASLQKREEIESNKETQFDVKLASKQEEVSELKAEYEEGKKQLAQSLKELEEAIPKAKEEAKTLLNQLKQKVNAGSVGCFGTALHYLSEANVGRCIIKVTCKDCHKSDMKVEKYKVNVLGQDIQVQLHSREVAFIMPTLREMVMVRPGDMGEYFSPCYDCDQSGTRHFPVIPCDRCSTVDRMRLAFEQVYQGLVMLGVKPKPLNKDGQYPMPLDGSKPEKYTPSEWVKQIMRDAGFEVEEEKTLSASTPEPNTMVVGKESVAGEE